MTNPKDDQRYTGLAGHVREGKVLVPPLLALPGLRLTSWMNSRLPEFLWVGLLQSAIPRLEVLDGLRALGPTFEELRSPRNDLSLTAIASSDLRDTIIPALCREPHWRTALAPLRLFRDLPGLDSWAQLLPEPEREGGWRALKIAAASMLDHQSEVATDARWACVFAKITSGFIHFTSKAQEQSFQQILAYPREGDLRKVRPTIRSMDAAFLSEESEREWPTQFWSSCLSSTPCDVLGSSMSMREPALSVSPEAVSELRGALVERCGQTRTTSAVDPRHDGAFGLAIYACSLLGELTAQGQGETILSRLGLRTLLEATITLSFLMKHGTAENWSEFRSFGAGQAKLALLKLSGLAATPTSVDVPSLEALASEDAWLEFVKVDLSTWAKKDLRRLSDQCGLKDLYDRFYPWTSAYAHSQWHATRDVVFDTCGNPLHRLHRVPRPEKRALPNAVVDAASLVDALTALIDAGFPGAQPLPRLLPPEAAHGSPSAGVAAAHGSASPLVGWHETLLGLQAQVFEAYTGVPPDRFVQDGQTFGQAINELGATFKANPGLAERRSQSIDAALNALVGHYEATGQQRLDAAKSVPGTKCVLGGQQSLTEAAAEAALCAAAYFETVLVPDPVHRWFEREPTEEAFHHVRMLEDIYNVGRLHPARTRQTSPILLFPSLEKVLEEKDTVTQDGIGRLIVDVCNGVLGASFDAPQDLAEWAQSNEEQFLTAVSESGLFVPCGGSPGMPLKDALELQRTYIAQWRSASFKDQYGSASDVLMVLMHIGDRLAPMFHLLDNAGSFDACPVFASPIHWHYFRLCFRIEATRLLADPSMPLFPETIRALEDLAERARPGTSDFAPGALFAARDEARFVGFRKSLGGLVSLLDAATGSGLDGLLRCVALELPRLLSSLELGDPGRRTENAAGVVPPRVAALPWLPTLGARTTLPRPFVAPRVHLGRVPVGFYFPAREE